LKSSSSGRRSETSRSPSVFTPTRGSSTTTGDNIFKRTTKKAEVTLFNFDNEGKQKGRKKKIKRSFRGKVTPSLVAIVQRISGPQIRPGRVTGLEIRPLSRRRRRRL